MKYKYKLALLGAVFCGLFLWGYLSFQQHTIRKSNRRDYNLILVFSTVDGIFPGSDVMIAGVPVGTVTSTSLDENQAIVNVSISKKYKLPADSSASIYTDGLLGRSYVNINPGSDDEMLQPGDIIEMTQGTLPITDMVGIVLNKFIDQDKAKAAKPNVAE